MRSVLEIKSCLYMNSPCVHEKQWRLNQVWTLKVAYFHVEWARCTCQKPSIGKFWSHRNQVIQWVLAYWLQLGSSRNLVAILGFTGDSHTLEVNNIIFGTSGTVKKMQNVRFLLWYFCFFGCEITITFMSARIFRWFWEKVSPFDCQFLGNMYPFPSPARILIQRPCWPYVLMGVPSSIVTIS